VTRTLTVVFDGEVFRPTEPVELPAGSEYRQTRRISEGGQTSPAARSASS
jgi:hypothetical protein